MKNRLYISGPMTGVANKNYKAFYKAALSLRNKKIAVVNPWELDVMDAKDTWEDCLRRDIVALMTCTGVATLSNWKKSRGALLEVYIGKALKMPVHTVKYWRTHNE